MLKSSCHPKMFCSAMEGINGTTHPLQTPIILEQIFGNLGYQDLEACRMVCKEWHNSSTKLFFMQAKVTIIKMSKENEIQNTRTLPRFLDCMLRRQTVFSNQSIPNNYSLSEIAINDTGYIVEDRFWTLCGQQIHSLELGQVKFESVDAFRTAIFQQCPNLKNLVLNRILVIGDRPKMDNEWKEPTFSPNLNLKSLELRCISVQFNFGIGPMELIARFPSLENLDIMNILDESYAIDLLSSLAIARRRDNDSWKIKSLSFNLNDVKSRPDLISLLREDIPPLETLGMQFSNHSNETIEISKAILNRHAEVLKKLHIESINPFDISELLSSKYWTFENIEELKIEYVNINSTTFPFSTPNLRILLLLEVSQFSISNIPTGLSYPSCHSLLLGNQSALRAEDIFKLKDWFPNLKTLRIQHLDNETFAIVCEQWPNLKHLEVQNGSIDDTGISGFDAEDVEEINLAGEDGSWRPISVPRANLSSLKSLEVLNLNFKTSTLPDYCSKAYGVSQLAHLKQFHISRELIDPPKGRLWNDLLAKFRMNTNKLMQFIT